MSRRRDRRRMGRALRLACEGRGRTGENPSVGCVICTDNGVIIAQARTADGGRPHAEEIALESAGPAARGGTAYVTLEPCRERSSGAPACSQRLIEAGLSRIVVAVRDEHPQGAGGIARLKAAAIRVDTGLKAPAARALYRDFFEHAKSGQS
ncbi:MAG: bifunctional diaminohydroxyphosphoribosylaminopyrimidine deaminase/5-amino-6-(5-phosphoribosylamino)uracil reductase RibD [Hyphomonadaceae bacterium]|nr:bifunctional diaminohydroxyphosphoribosylaminopyrimidine deaminase/5-amino-6-(5-phosphoribosylamino)uracil reductase RibD [Hyphomonadaceae bacterium]